MRFKSAIYLYFGACYLKFSAHRADGGLFSVALAIPAPARIFPLGSTVLVGVRTFLPARELRAGRLPDYPI